MAESEQFIYPIRLYTSEAKNAETYLLQGKANKRRFELSDSLDSIIDNPFRPGAPLVQFISTAANRPQRDELMDRVLRQVSDPFEMFFWLVGHEDGSFIFSEREGVRIPDPNIGGLQKRGENEIFVALLLLPS